jgi:hypothetical protein
MSKHQPLYSPEFSVGIQTYVKRLVSARGVQLCSRELLEWRWFRREGFRSKAGFFQVIPGRPSQVLLAVRQLRLDAASRVLGAGHFLLSANNYMLDVVDSSFVVVHSLTNDEIPCLHPNIGCVKRQVVPGQSRSARNSAGRPRSRQRLLVDDVCPLAVCS